jgi:hypothetical protein
MRQIAPRLVWIGNAGDLRDPRELLAAGIEAIVELADNEQFAAATRCLRSVCCTPLDAGATQPNVPPFVSSRSGFEACGRKEPRFFGSGQRRASGVGDCQPHGGRDRGRSGKANLREASAELS